MINKVVILPSKQPINKIPRKRVSSSPNIFFPPQKPKSPSFYQKIYSISPDSLNESKKEDNQNNKNQKKSVSLKNVFKKPKFLSTPFQFRKITNPKLPFSKRTIEPKEITKNKIKLKKPSKIFHNFETIQWLRKKYSENIINKSIYSLLPNNGKPVIPEDESEEDKRHRKMIEYLESLKEPIGREKYVSINPKYFFNRTTFETVLKLKKIFLEFDADGNRRMELDEMLEMFESNKISANINDLVDLFFRGKKFKEKEVLKLYLNFHQFINFALTKDQDFRQFMRNIKERAEKEKNKTKSGDKSDTEEEKDGYLPMSFKSLLDYFIDKGKERDSKEVINKAIEEMNEIINKTKLNRSNNNIKKLISQKTLKYTENQNKSMNFNLSKKKTIISQKTLQPGMFKCLIKDIKDIRQSSKNIMRKRNKLEDELDKLNMELNLTDDLNIDYDKQLKDINFEKLIQEFSNLFNINQINYNKQNKNINYMNNNVTKPSIQNILEENKTIKNEGEKKTGRSMKKSYSQSLLNSVSTRSQENIKNNLLYGTKGGYSTTFYKPHNYEFKNRKEFKIIGKNKNKFLSAKLDDRKSIISENEKTKNFNFNYGKESSRNNNHYLNIENFQNDKNFNFMNKTKDSFSKIQIGLPQVNGNRNKSSENERLLEKNINFNNEKLSPKSRFTKSKIKNDFIKNGLINRNSTKKHKFYINYYGGKINLVNNSNDSLINSNSKLDYVPLKLLINPKCRNKSII